jgi:hypothetical protein
VADYLTSLTWDGISRIDTWLEDFCSVKATSPDHQRMIRAVGRKWLISCVARAVSNGCRVNRRVRVDMARSSQRRSRDAQDLGCAGSLAASLMVAQASPCPGSRTRPSAALSGPRGAKYHYVDGVRMGSLLDLVPLQYRPLVTASQPPETVGTC